MVESALIVLPDMYIHCNLNRRSAAVAEAFCSRKAVFCLSPPPQLVQYYAHVVPAHRVGRILSLQGALVPAQSIMLLTLHVACEPTAH